MMMDFAHWEQGRPAPSRSTCDDPRALTTPLLGRILLDAIWEIFILGFKTTPMENSHETKHCTDKTRDLLRRHDLPGLVRLRRRPRELLTGKRGRQLGLHLYWDAFRPHCRYTSRLGRQFHSGWTRQHGWNSEPQCSGYLRGGDR